MRTYNIFGHPVDNTDWIKEVQDKNYMPACDKLHFASHIMQADRCASIHQCVHAVHDYEETLYSLNISQDP